MNVLPLSSFAAASCRFSSFWLSYRSVVTIQPEPPQRVLALVRRAAAVHPDSAAVVVANARIRRFARKLIELEFPSMFVLSEEELLPERTNTRLRHGAVPCKGLTR